MNNSMKMTLSLALAAVTATSVTQTATVQDVATKTAVGFAALSALKYCFTKPTEEPDRYDTCQLARGENLANNLYYLYVDGFLGHDEKEVGFEVIQPDDKSAGQNTIVKKKKISARGIIGKLHANYLKPFTNVIMFVVTFRALKDNMNKGFKGWSDFSIAEFFTLQNPDTQAKAAAAANQA